jgi:cellulose synthase operon protein C
VTAIGPWPSDTRILQIEDLRLDLERRRIEGADGQELPQRVFDLLLLLMAEPNRLHTRAELFERLWPGLVVEDANLSQSVWLLRKALGESRKHWIRTISKRGYLFEPPGPLQWFAEPPAQARNEQVATAPQPSSPAPPQAQISSPAPPTWRLRLPSWWRWAAACAVLAIVIAITVITLQRRDPQSPPTQTQAAAVALIRVQDAGTSEHWPAWLLYEWLKWKLGSLPEVTLLSEADLAAGVGTPPQVVFLTSNPAPEAPGKIVVMARFQHAGAEQRFEMQGTPEQMPAMVDALSQRVMQRLLPRRNDTWPKLDLSADAARQYADAAQAFERRDWMATTATGRNVVQLAPRFGLMHLQLALALSRLAQANAAIEEMNIARDLLQPIPSETRALLEAQRLGVDPQRRRQAADAYAALAGRNPDNIHYAIEQANLLARSKPQQALTILQANRRKPQSVETRIALLLALAQTYQELGDPVRMRVNAKAAEGLARNAGSGWNRELAQALELLGFASLHQGDFPAAIPLFEQAATTWKQVGNRTGELHAQSLAQMFATPGKAKDAKLAALLADANANGDRGLEVNILLQFAWDARQAGNLPEHRRRLEQAASVANAAGDLQAQQRVATLLLNEQILAMRLDDAQRVLQRLQDVEGDYGVFIGLNEVTLDILRGRYDLGMDALERTARKLPPKQPGQAPSESQASLACMQVELALPQGDLQGARKDARECASAKEPDNQADLLLYRAAIALYSGDRDEARAQLQRVRERPESLGYEPHFGRTIEAARLLARAGDIAGSDEMLAPLLTKLPPTGYRLLVALAETGRAENCAARADWTCMRTHVAAARQGLPNDVWYVSSRLDLLDGVAALATGERERAAEIGQQLVAEAKRHGDVAIQLQAYDLALQSGTEGHRAAERDTLVARTGMRGVNLDWLQLNTLR